MIRFLLYMLMLLTPGRPFAGEEAPASGANASKPPPVEAPGVQSPPGTPMEAGADPDNLKQQSPSDAFRDFRPSEEISADNAVAFPVDI